MQDGPLYPKEYNTQKDSKVTEKTVTRKGFGIAFFHGHVNLIGKGKPFF